MSTADIQLSVVFGGQYSFEKLQSDYEQTDTLARDYIKNKPDLVNFESETVTTETVIFDESPTGAIGAMKLQYSPDEKVLEFGLADGGRLQIGKEMFEEYTNIDTVALTNGMIVSTAAIPGNRKGIKRTDFTNLTSIRSIVGMVTIASIGTNQSGRVTTKGVINELNTNGIAECSQLWGNPAVLGGWSVNKPAKPQYAVQIGQVVVSSSTVGSIELNIAKDVKFSDLADVNGSTNLIDDTDTIPKRDADGIIREITVADIKADFKADTDALYEPLLGFTPEDSANKGQPNGYASLGADGLVPSNQLPSFVDDVLEFANLAAFPVTGEQGKIYVALDTNKTYRWSGSAYIYITSGAVDSVAGKTGVVTLVKADVGLGNVDNTSDVNKPVSTAQQNALDLKIDKTLSSEITTVGDSETMAVKASDNIWKRITWASIKATLKTYFETLFVTLTGAQNIAGVKTFTDKPIVPTPTGSTEAANKGYVDSAVVDAMPAATKALEPELAYYTRVLADSGSIQDLNKLTELYIKNLQLLDSTVFLWSGVAGMKTRTSGSNQFASKLYNMANKVQQFGSELVTNGTFTGADGSTPAGWIGSSATLTIDTNRLKITNNSTGIGGAYQQIATTVGKTYHFAFSLTVGLSGARFMIGTAYANSSMYDSGNNFSSIAKTVSFVATSTTTFITIINSTNVNGDYNFIDNISVKQMDWVEGINDAVQTTEANQPYVGGVIAPNEVRKLKQGVVNSTSRFAPVVFASNENFSITITYLKSNRPTYYVLTDDAGITSLQIESLVIRLYSASGTNYIPYTTEVGKNTILTVVKTDGYFNLYINGRTIAGASVANGTYNFSRIFSDNGGVTHAQIHNKALSASEVQAQHEYLRLQIPEIEGVAIGNQYWATSNYEGVVAGDGSVIPEVKENNNVEKITDPIFSLTANQSIGVIGTHWRTFANTSIVNNQLICDGLANGRIDTVIDFTTVAGRVYKKTIKVESGIARALFLTDGSQNFGDTIKNYTAGEYVEYFVCNASGNFGQVLFYNNSGGTDCVISKLSLEEVGWSQSTAVYDAIYAQTSGTLAQKEIAALKAAAMWCHYNNDVNNGAIFGKLYNHYAIALLTYYPPKGWRVPSSADVTQMQTYLGGSTVAGGKMKALYGGFNNSFATNESGLTILPTGRRDPAGTFTNLSNFFAYNGFLTSDKFSITAKSDSTSLQIQVNVAYPTLGSGLRLLRNEPVGPNERTITSTTIVSDIASTANSTQIPFGYSVASIRLKTTANLTNIKVELWNNFYSGTPTLVATLITGKTANNTTMVFPVLADCPALLQDGTLRITATGANTFETIVEYNLQKNTL